MGQYIYEAIKVNSKRKPLTADRLSDIAKLIGVTPQTVRSSMVSETDINGWSVSRRPSDNYIKKNKKTIAKPCEVININRNTVEYKNTLENCAEYMGLTIVEAVSLFKGKSKHRTYVIKEREIE